MGKDKLLEAERYIKERRMAKPLKRRFTMAHSAVKGVGGLGQGTNQIPVPRRKTTLES